MQDAQDIRSSHAATNLTRLMAMLEEADTRLIRHAIDVHFDTVVLILLVSKFGMQILTISGLWRVSNKAKVYASQYCVS